MSCQPVGGWSLPGPLGLDDAGIDPQVQFLQASRQANTPAGVTEISPTDTGNSRNSEREKLDASIGVESVDALDQTDPGNLQQIFGLLATVGRALGQVPRLPRSAVGVDWHHCQCRRRNQLAQCTQASRSSCQPPGSGW